MTEFHPLVSWMCTVGLFDNLTLEPVHIDPTADRGAGSPYVTLSCDAPDLAIDQTNLVDADRCRVPGSGRVRLIRFP